MPSPLGALTMSRLLVGSTQAEHDERSIEDAPPDRIRDGSPPVGVVPFAVNFGAAIHWLVAHRRGAAPARR